MPDTSSPEMVVIRFGPYSASGMATNAEGTHARDRMTGHPSPRLGVSVMVSEISDGETVEAAADRLCRELIGVEGAPNGEKIAISTASTLSDEGFDLVLNEPPPGHYLAGNSKLQSAPDTEKLAEVFRRRKLQKNPVYRERKSDG